MFCNHLTNDLGISAILMVAHGGQHLFRFCGCNNSHEFSFIGHIERVNAKNLANRGDRIRNRNRFFLELHPKTCTLTEFIHGCGQSPPGRIAQGVDMHCLPQHGLNKTV